MSSSGEDMSVRGNGHGGTYFSVQNIGMSFGGLRVLDDVSFDVHQHEIVGLIGPNGAGKTTVFNLVSGFLPSDRGETRFAGRRIDRWRGDAIARAGLVRAFQTARVLTRMSVLDNMLLAAQRQPGERLFTALLAPGRVARREREIRQRAGELLELVRLAHLAGAYAGTLSGGQRKLLELGRALMVEPRRILLDGVPVSVTREGDELVAPDGRRFLYWKDEHVWAYELATDRHVNLTAGAPVSFTNAEWDYLSTRPSYGLAGWTKDGRGVILNHRYDLWYVPFDGGAARGGYRSSDAAGRGHTSDVMPPAREPCDRRSHPPGPSQGAGGRVIGRHRGRQGPGGGAASARASRSRRSSSTVIRMTARTGRPGPVTTASAASDGVPRSGASGVRRTKGTPGARPWTTAAFPTAFHSTSARFSPGRWLVKPPTTSNSHGLPRASRARKVTSTPCGNRTLDSSDRNPHRRSRASATSRAEPSTSGCT